MNIEFINYWKRNKRAFVLICLESFLITTATKKRRMTTIGLFNFSIVIRHKPKTNA